MTRLLRWFLAHDPTTACQLDPTVVAAENKRLRERLQYAQTRYLETLLELKMRDNAAELLAGVESTPIADRIAFNNIVADWDAS